MSNIIELSYINSQTSNSSADWVNTFQPIVLNPQDSLAFKVGFLDYGNNNQYGVIEIGEDTNISMRVGFYLNTASDSIDSNINPDPTGNAKDFKLYVARDSNLNLIESTVNFTINKGVYTPEELCIMINKILTVLPQSSLGSNADLVNNPQSYFFRSSQLGEAVCEFYIAQYSDTNIWRCFVRDRDSSQLNNFNVGDYAYFYSEFDPNTNSFECGISAVVISDNDGSYIELSPYETSPPQQSYRNGYIIKNNASKHTQVTPIKFFDPVNILYNPAEVGDQQYITCEKPTWIGASQIDLQFDFNQSGRFSFEYLHTSCHDSTAENNTCINVYGVDETFLEYRNVYSGIFFTNLEPASFWQDILGFDLEKIIFTDNTITHNLNKVFEFGQNITGDLISFDDVYNKSKTAEAIEGYLNVIVSQTFNIIGNKLTNIQTSPYFIVQLIGLGNPNYAMDNRTLQTIAHVGSKEYDNNGSITLFGDGSNFFTNTGEQKIISSLNVRILDGNTKQPTQILGQNNSIFIQINRINPNIIKDF